MEREYELMYLVRPELDEEGLQGAVDSVRALIENAGGEVTTSTSWGRRRLAYEVKHLRDGHYMLLTIRLDRGRVAGVERALAIHETVFRHLLVIRESTTAAAAQPGGADLDGTRPAARQAAVAAPAQDLDDDVSGEELDDELDTDDEADDVLAATEEDT